METKKNLKSMLREGSLDKKVIIVTGGGTGLGKAMATEFSELGAKVVIASRKFDALKTAAAEISARTGNTVLPVQCDVTNYSDIENTLKKAVAEFGPVNVWVNNAAGNFISPTERLSYRAFDVIVNIVLRGGYYSTLCAGKYWIENKIKGTVLNIVTTYAWTGSAYVVPSAVSKAGMLALTRSLAVEWGKYGIRLNAIAPGPFPTKGAWERLLPGDLAKKFDFKNKVPLQRVGEHKELANLAAYLVSDYSGYVNGEVVTIDGGEWLKGAGQFNMLELVPNELWDEIENMVRKANKSKPL